MLSLFVHSLQMTFHSSIRTLAALPALLASVASHAQLTDFLQDSTSVKHTFAIYDIQAPDAALPQLREIVMSAVKVYATKNKVNDEFMPVEVPRGTVPQMELKKATFQGLNGYDPKCENALFSIDGSNDSYVKYGEMSRVLACIFKYENGYRLNYYGLYLRQTSGSSVQGLGAMLGRAITGAVGLGDSSKFIVTTMDDFHKRIGDAGYAIKLVKLLPAMEGKVVEADPAAGLRVTLAAAPSPAPAAAAAALPAALPAAVPVAAVAAAPKPASQEGKSISQGLDLSVVGSRKELSAMGFKFYDQDAFVAAAKRNDFITFRLFLAAAGISPSGADSQGVTAASVAKGQEMKFLLAAFTEAEKVGSYPGQVAN